MGRPCWPLSTFPGDTVDYRVLVAILPLLHQRASTARIINRVCPAAATAESTPGGITT